MINGALPHIASLTSETINHLLRPAMAYAWGLCEWAEWAALTVMLPCRG